MSHEIETMYYVSNEENGRFRPWHGLGTPVGDALSSEEALKIAGLDWEVESKPIFVDGKEVLGYKANVRSSDDSILGVVGSRYSIVQNKDAFAFTDALLGEGVRYETAGSLKNGRRIWLNAKMDTVKILDDDVQPYMVFTNTHDGTGAVRVAMTPVRTVCNNTLNLALKEASRSWSTRHVGSIEDRIQDARECLGLANHYMEALAKEADRYANEKISGDEVAKVIVNLFPCAKDATDRAKKSIQAQRDSFMACYFAPDIQKFIGTKWGLINAASDYTGHNVPVRATANFEENRFARILDGDTVLDKVMKMI